MPECRGCGVALAPDELQFCQECWHASEQDDEIGHPGDEIDPTASPAWPSPRTGTPKDGNSVDS